MDEENLKEILKIIRDIINEFSNSEIEDILKQPLGKEQKVLNPFQGFQEKGIINYKKLFQLALEEKNYERVNRETFCAQFLELVSKIHEKNETIGEKLLERVVAKLDEIKDLLKK